MNDMTQLVMVKPGKQKFSGSDFAIGAGLGFIVGAIIFTAVGRQLAKETILAGSKAATTGAQYATRRLREYRQ